jgi:hypothetical protein
MLTSEDHRFVGTTQITVGAFARSFVSFGTEAGLYSDMGIPTVVLVPA